MKRRLLLESLQERSLLAVTGIGQVEVQATETYRDFVFDVAGTFSGKNTAPGGYLDRYSGSLSNASGTATFTSPTEGQAEGTGTVKVTGRDNFESYSKTVTGAGSLEINNGQLSNIFFNPNIAPGLAPTGTFNPSTWQANVSWNGIIDGLTATGSFTGQVSQKLPLPDFSASISFDTTEADAAHTDQNSIGDVADKVKANVTIQVTGQHLRVPNMGADATTARVYLGDPDAGGVELVTPVPIHWNTDKITLSLSHFLNNKNRSGSIFVVVDKDNLVAESNESNNKIKLAIPYDIVSQATTWASDGSVFGLWNVSVFGFNNSVIGSTNAKLAFADDAMRILDALPATPDVIEPISITSVSSLSRPTTTAGSFLLPSAPLTYRPEGATQIVLLTDHFILPPNAEINEGNNAASLKLTELSLKSSKTTATGVQFVVNVSQAPLAFATTADVYWASGTNSSPTLLRKATSSALAAGKFGDVSFSKTFSDLGSIPAGATQLVVILDPTTTARPMGKILEPNENNRYVANAAPTSLSLDNLTILENKAAGTAIGKFSAINTESGEQITYSLVKGTGDTGNASFSINSAGELVSKSKFNFESKSSYSVRVRATDQLGLFVEKAFTIKVLNVNEAPTNITLTKSQVGENLAVGTEVGKLSAKDPDAGAKLTFSLVPIAGSTDHQSFKIVGNQLVTAKSFDFETRSSYTLKVKVQDQFGLSSFKTVVVNITDVPGA